MSKAFIVDDDPSFTSALAEYLSRLDMDAEVMSSLREARHRCRQTTPDLVLLDLILPDGSGMDLLDEIDQERTRLVIITGHPSVERAVESLRARVHDFLVKPLDFKRLGRALAGLGEGHNIASSRDDDKDTEPASRRIAELSHSTLLIGEASIFRQTLIEIEKVAATDATVLIEGETGTGKELVAQAIHRLSPRCDGPFLTLNCGALPTELIGSELFGHERGSFTGATNRHVGYIERAQGGTLLLDEVTEMPLELQAHLLRVLETGSFVRIGGESEHAADARIIAATNRQPEAAVASGRFRQDLYYRLMVFPIRLPPLRARGGDVTLLAEYFVNLLNEQGDSSVRLTADAARALQTHTWPGNVRELRNAMQRAFILADQGVIDAEHLQPFFESSIAMQPEQLTLRPGMSLADAERRLIEATLTYYKGHKRAAAESLGISLKTLYNRLNLYRSEDQATTDDLGADAR